MGLYFEMNEILFFFWEGEEGIEIGYSQGWKYGYMDTALWELDGM